MTWNKGKNYEMILRSDSVDEDSRGDSTAEEDAHMGTEAHHGKAKDERDHGKVMNNMFD